MKKNREGYDKYIFYDAKIIKIILAYYFFPGQFLDDKCGHIYFEHNLLLLRIILKNIIMIFNGVPIFLRISLVATLLLNKKFEKL